MSAYPLGVVASELNRHTNAPLGPWAEGGDVVFIDGWEIHTFTGNGTLTVLRDTNADYLVVGGGGGGSVGGGGAGGLLTGTDTVLVGDLPVTVGAGGAGETSSADNAGTGSNSVWNGHTALGGGAGGFIGNGHPGGSGGGGGGIGGGGGGAGTVGQGNNGGGPGGGTCGAGGGGSGAVGQQANPSGGDGHGGDGGAGTSSSISGSSVDYAGGGGGGGTASQGNGAAGGGNGANFGPGAPAAANTGSGGGGIYSASPGGAGGSGVVILRALGSPRPDPPSALVLTPGATSIDVAWTNSPSGNVDHYEYRVSHDGGSTWSPDWTTTPSGSPFTISGLTAGTEYTVALRAVDTDAIASTVISDTASTPSTYDALMAGLISNPLDVYYPMTETSGTTIQDSSGNGLNLTASATIVGDGTSIQFDGNYDASRALAFTSAFHAPKTEIVWLKTSTVVDTLAMLMWRTPGGGDAGGLFLNFVGDDGNAELYLNSGARGAWGGNALNNNQWHMLAFVHDVGFDYSVYLDGVAVRAGGGDGIGSSNATTLFVASNDGIQKFIGSLRRVSVLHTLLSDSDIAALWAAG